MSVYRQAKNPFVVGELRTKVWRALLPPVVAQDDPTWAKRCKDYWELQERLYGVRMSNYVMWLDTEESIVVTCSTVLEVLPGERTLDYDRVPAVRVQ